MEYFDLNDLTICGFYHYKYSGSPNFWRSSLFSHKLGPPDQQ